MINVLTFIKYFLRLAVIIMLLGNLGICVDFPKATFPIFSRLTFDAIKVYGQSFIEDDPAFCHFYEGEYRSTEEHLGFDISLVWQAAVRKHCLAGCKIFEGE